MGSKKTSLKSLRDNQRSYLNKDFASFRAELNQYGETYFSDKITDFSENGLAGMFIEMTAYIGDVMAYYLDHQFNELNILTATESDNIERLVKSAGVEIKGASPAAVKSSFYLEIPALYSNNEYMPDSSKSPVIKTGTVLVSTTGVKFELLEDLNFGSKDSQGNILAEYETMKTDSNGDPSSFSVRMVGHCVSGITMSESATVPDSFSPFRSITLGSANVSEIISVTDTDGHEYYQVSALTQDAVYKRVANSLSDSDLVSENIEMIPAPRRFVSTTSRNSGLTTIQFGGGSALSTDDDIMPDPSEISLPLYGDIKTFSRFAIDQNKLMQTRTLGIAPRNIGEVFGIFKAYCTRVGSGPFPTELNDAVGEDLRKRGHEFGASTGRPRRCGWLDLPALNYACMLNGVTQLYMMKTDVLSGMGEIGICEKYLNTENTMEIPFYYSGDAIQAEFISIPVWQQFNNQKSFSELPIELTEFISRIETYTKTPIGLISHGPDRKETIFRN